MVCLAVNYRRSDAECRAVSRQGSYEYSSGGNILSSWNSDWRVLPCDSRIFSGNYSVCTMEQLQFDRMLSCWIKRKRERESTKVDDIEKKSLKLRNSRSQIVNASVVRSIILPDLLHWSALILSFRWNGWEITPYNFNNYACCFVLFASGKCLGALSLLPRTAVPLPLLVVILFGGHFFWWTIFFTFKVVLCLPRLLPSALATQVRPSISLNSLELSPSLALIISMATLLHPSLPISFTPLTLFTSPSIGFGRFITLTNFILFFIASRTISPDWQLQ